MTPRLLPTYARVDLAFERGDGPWLLTTDGERYLDFTAGVAVNGLGHAHPHLIAALAAQAQKLWHVSDLFRIPEAERVAERLCAETFADLIFSCNSGAEAMECCIEVARKYRYASGQPQRHQFITFEGAFLEPDIADAIERIDRSAGRIERAPREKKQDGKEAAKVES